jgi:hypothetical protein
LSLAMLKKPRIQYHSRAMKGKIVLPALILFLMICCTYNTDLKTQKLNLIDTVKTKYQLMENKSFTATILVDKSPATVFRAIQNFRAWWSEEIEGNTDKLNEEFFYHYKDIHLCKMKLTEAVADKKLVYQVLDNQFNFIQDKTEWINTKLIFEISTEGNKTKVHFTHEGLVPTYECYDVCNDAWSGYINKSLFHLISTGKGEPNPKDKDGFNAELAEKWKLKSGK